MTGKITILRNFELVGVKFEKGQEHLVSIYQIGLSGGFERWSGDSTMEGSLDPNVLCALQETGQVFSFYINYHCVLFVNEVKPA